MGYRTFPETNRRCGATQVGYANGNIANPTYQQVCTGTTDFAETVKVQYDPDEVDLPFLIDLYFKTIDPTSLNKQGGDRGTQYRTGIYYTDTADLPVIRETVDRLAANYSRPLVVEIEPLKNFYPAEDYHQDYLTKIRVDIATLTPPCSTWRVKRR